MAVGKLKKYYFKRSQGHYDFKIHTDDHYFR